MRSPQRLVGATQLRQPGAVAGSRERGHGSEAEVCRGQNHKGEEAGDCGGGAKSREYEWIIHCTCLVSWSGSVTVTWVFDGFMKDGTGGDKQTGKSGRAETHMMGSKL